MANPKGWRTAREIMEQLEADPEWVRQRDERRALHAASVEKLRLEMEPEHAPLMRDLAAIGMKVRSTDDVVNMSAPYPEAVPVLLRHLQTARHPVMRNSLARSLTVREARGVAGGPILRELKRERDSEVRFAMANALTIVATRDDADEIAALLADPGYEDVHDRLGQVLKNLRLKRRKRPRPKPPT